MIKKLKTLIIATASLAVLAAPAFVPATASAAPGTPNNIQGCVQQGTNIEDGPFQSGSDCSAYQTGGPDNSSLNGIIQDVVNIFTVLVGVASIIMIIYGGFKYITSGGESEKISKAKNTLIFAIVGLIIVASAQFIVHFVLNKITSEIGSMVVALSHYLPF